MSKDVTIPLRECSACGEQHICRDQENGERLCSMCETIAGCADACVDGDEDQLLKNLVLRINDGGDPVTIEELFLLQGTFVGAILRYLIDNPHHLNRLASESRDRFVAARVLDVLGDRAKEPSS